ncbi:hypothetical protein BLBBOR_575 [Blattabacterium sp. (Blatta orientalis) str. Tarazona]|uniref:DUF3341 domain-containing protein n=1 Tax=Blattabacterium sp. (Blatta orientalis) TaxID=367806 RepID=UPI0002AD7655|nr:DUF3341 domain-containing protein [Blattabacterium sp. (Blatta orientalis)]AGD98447.1 hypothetical protein BLBBOR_575 [Blattabacterium sp. (Blatta orientalis) str. Tarazona]
MNKFVFNIQALYDHEDLMINHLKILRKKNINIHEVYSPFPIHNLNKLLELKKTNLSFLSFIYGLIGFFTGCLLTWYTMIYDWPQNIGGKPSSSWIHNLPSFIPVIFELSIFFLHILCASLIFFNVNYFQDLLQKNPDPRTTDNMFLIEIYTEENAEKLRNFLKENGAMEVNITKIVQT